MTNSQQCLSCGEAKPLEDFYRSAKHVSGRASKCKTCERDRLRRFHAENPDAASRYLKRWRQRHPEKVAEAAPKRPEVRRAHLAVFRAMQKGGLIRPGSCDDCGKECKPQAHHEDYSRPLDVQWLCSSCHMLLHYREKAA